MPVTMTRPDGRPFTLFVYYQRYSGPGWSTGNTRGAIELPDGRTKPFQDVIPDLQFHDDNRRLLGGSIRTVLPGWDRILVPDRSGIRNGLSPRHRTLRRF